MLLERKALVYITEFNFSPLLKFPSIALEATCPFTVLDCSAVVFVARLTENNERCKSFN